MKIKEIRTRAVRWRGKTVPLPPHFCTNPMDLLTLPEASMQTFTFHGWLIVEIFTDDGHVGIGNAALAPPITKQVIDLYLKPLLLGADPWNIEFLWQHMYRKTMAFGRKGIGMAAISAVDIALWDLLGKSAKQPVFRLLGGRTKPRIPVYASRLYSTELSELAAEAKRYKKEGYQAMKLRFGWGPADGAAGMQQNVALVKTVREAVGDGIDVMADAYMGWTLDYAKRMLPLLEAFQSPLAGRARNPRRHPRLCRTEILRAHPHRRRRTRIHAIRLPRSARSSRRGLHPIRHQPRRWHHPSPQNLRASRIAFRPRNSPRRTNAQLPRRNGEPEFPHGRIFPHRGRRSWQRTFLVYLRRRAQSQRRFRGSRRQSSRPGPYRKRKSSGKI